MAVSGNSSLSQNGEIEEIDVARRFDVVSDESDHAYVVFNRNTKKGGGDCFTNAGSGVHKRIMKEWKILEKNLPDSIFVRVYEKRIDLLRAAIIGAAGTPYHDGLFFFDIAFPTDYPNQPPLVHYRSSGFRLNPNLYANGKVCLSLLNTWTGKKCEKWNSASSTVFQLLVSIQALVLNEKPYFNEPGTGMLGRAMSEKKSQAYNENAFLLSCKTMLFLLKKHPKNFESFVTGHFQARAHAILSACCEYANGRARVGCSTNDGSSSAIVVVSEKFKLSLQQLYPQLIDAFRKAGACLNPSIVHLEMQKQGRTPTSRKQNDAKKKKKSVAKKVVEKIRMVLGLKKVREIDENAIKIKS